jgi:hypothetical protein
VAVVVDYDASSNPTALAVSQDRESTWDTGGCGFGLGRAWGRAGWAVHKAP